MNSTTDTDATRYDGLAFIDCETTGLDPYEHHVWEVACVVRRGQFVQPWTWQLRLPHGAVNDAEPEALAIGRFHARYGEIVTSSDLAFAHEFAAMVHGCVWVGCNPTFDLRFIEPLLKSNGIAPTWHYRPVCAESLAFGYLNAVESCMADAFDVQRRSLRVPWSNRKDLAPRLGIEPDPLAHTALADARYAMRLYERVTGTFS